jgi:RecA-family ATPase
MPQNDPHFKKKDGKSPQVDGQGSLFIARSLIEWAESPKKEEDILLADGWLEIGGIAMISAASGLGKSVAANQITALWSCGEPAFHIRPTRPLTILMLQGEDSHNDSVTMAQVVNHLGFSNEQKELINTNTMVGPLDACDPEAFLNFLAQLLASLPIENRPDVLVINPYNNYTGDDRDPKANKAFGSGLKKLMMQYRFGTLIIHHTPKTNYQSTDGYKSEDWQYADAGGWLITANARAKIIVKSTSEVGTYRFVAAKRGYNRKLCMAG